MAVRFILIIFLLASIAPGCRKKPKAEAGSVVDSMVVTSVEVKNYPYTDTFVGTMLVSFRTDAMDASCNQPVFSYSDAARKVYVTHYSKDSLAFASTKHIVLQPNYYVAGDSVTGRMRYIAGWVRGNSKSGDNINVGHERVYINWSVTMTTNGLPSPCNPTYGQSVGHYWGMLKK